LARFTIAAGDESMDRWQQIETLFFEALERAGAERAASLKAARGEDLDLRREIDALLPAHEHATPFAIEQRFLTPSADEPHPFRTPGARVGIYRLVEVIGEGGMGTVYLAERDDAQYRQEVALKLVRPGLNTRELETRFRMERQILARLQHPNVARLLDGGVTG